MFIFIVGALFGAEAQAQTTIQAASCNEADVQKAISQATTDGDVVTIPAGTCEWTTPLNVTLSNSITIQGAGAEYATDGGAGTTGTDQTIIVDDVNHSGSDPSTMAFTTASGKSFRLTGIAIYNDPDNTTPDYNGVIMIGGDSHSVRIDHCHFEVGSQYVEVNFQGWLYGVLDHCFFQTTAKVTNDIRVGDPGWNGSSGPGLGNASWADSDYFGSDKFMFIENNTFTGGFAFDCDNGGRFVFRHNTLNASQMQTHGTGGGQERRGCRTEEVYDNTMTWGNDPLTDTDAFALMLESGSGLFWGNTIQGGYIQFIHEDTVRTNTGTYTQTAPPNGWGYCGTTVTGSSSPWDGNTDPTGYPCLDQVGRGKGDLLTGSVFPNILDSITKSITWPHQALDPVYVWDNNYVAPPDEQWDALWANADHVTKENRDYYLQVPNYNEPGSTFNGTVGIGQGLYADRPSTCTPRVGYWATDKNTLYVCTATNTWTAYYTPYVYPYPLDTATSTTTKNPPQNLRVTTIH